MEKIVEKSEDTLRDEVIRRMANTPPTPKDEKKPPRKPKKKEPRE